MKKTLIVVALSLITVCGLFANGERETVTVEGKIAVKDSVPSIVSGDKTWVLPAGPFYQIAWENGIKVGDSVKAEGFVMDDKAPCNDNAGPSFMPTKVWINGKEINLSTIKRFGPPMEGKEMMRGGGRQGMGPDRDDRRDDR